MKVLRVIARLNVGGPARHVILADQGLRARGYETQLVFGSTGDGEASLQHLVDEAGIPFVQVPTLGRRISPWSDLVAFLALCRIMRQSRPDVVHTHTAKAGALGRLAAWLTSLAGARSPRIRIVHTFHGHVLEGYFPAWAEHLVRLAERTLARMTDRILVLSPRQRAEIVDRFRVARADRVSIVPLGLDLKRFLELPSGPSADARRQLGVPAGGFVVGYLGRLVAIKNLPLLIEAFGRLHQPVSTLLIAGDGTERPAIEREVATRGLEARVRFLGWCSDLPSFYSAIDVVALSSTNEGTPVALIEGMAAGRPVVATRVGGVPDLVEDGRTGLLVNAGDPAALAAALERIAGDMNLRESLGRAARARVRAAHTVDRLIDDLDRVYTQILQ